MNKEGKDYDQANKAASKEAAKTDPPPGPSSRDRNKQQQHEADVKKGKNPAESDSTPTQK